MSWKNLVELDKRLTAKLRLGPEHNARWKAAAFLAHSGDSWFWVAGLILVWLLNTEPVWHNRAAMIAVAVVGLAVLVLAIKFLVRRQRPEGEWGAIYRATDPHSFPSGHAARAMLLAVMACGLGPWWLAALLVIWMPFVSLSRVNTGLHYVSDVVVGAALGLVCGILALQLQPLVMQWFPFLFTV
ncbi:MAG TPA: phosphatase PAP2 family protein [Anaerolineaceae bacterium]|nr:phosphatase PAP2 family protein [Anaerolineaceae bacterium]